MLQNTVIAAVRSLKRATPLGYPANDLYQRRVVQAVHQLAQRFMLPTHCS